MFQPVISQELIIEQWVLSSFAVILLLLRLAIRLRTVGPGDFQGDDYASMGTILFTMLYAVSVHEAELKGNNLDITEDILSGLSRPDIKQLEYGSKMMLLSWYSYSALVWTLKATILCFYKRLTSGSYQANMVRYVAIATGLAYVVVFFTTTFSCFPYAQNWQVSPMAPWSCRYRPDLLIVVAVLNAVTSAGILCIPAPMLWKLKVPLRKKLVIALSLSSAVIVISCAIIRSSVTFSIAPTGANLNRWGVREVTVGTLAVNVPILRLIFTSAFWKKGPYVPDVHASPYKKSSRAADTERGVPLKAYEVGVRNSDDSSDNIMDDRHKGKDVVMVQTVMEIEHSDRDDTMAHAQVAWSTLPSSK